MKKIIIAIFFLIFIFWINLFSEAAEQSLFTFGPEISYIKYEEPSVMEEKGVMYGLDGAWTYYYEKHRLLKIEMRLSHGEVDYKNSGTLDNIEDYIIEGRGVIGYKFSVAERTDLIPYIGLGYRYLNDDAAGLTSSTGARGYERESNYLYSPIGMEMTMPINNTWSLGTMLEYDHFWRGWQKSHLSDAHPAFNDLENTQEHGYGLRASLKALRHGKDVDFIIEPFIRYWNIKKSEEKDITFSGIVIGYGYEPKNNSTEFGILVSLRWHWEQDKKQVSYSKKSEPKVKVELIPLMQEKLSTADAYYNSVREKITYALSSLKVIEKGQVILNLTLASNGEIRNCYITDKDLNMSPEFKQVVMQAISELSPFPEFPSDINKEKITLVLPIVFS